VKRFIFTSSGFIYGNTANRPINEEEPFQPISPYAISKQAIEHYLAFYQQVYGLSYVVLRLATVYGPRQVSGALSDYITRLAAGQQAEFFGDGSKTRDYVYIDDVVDALLQCIDLPAMPSPVFNIGSGRETSLRDIYAKIAELLGKKPEPIYRPDRPGELYGYSLSYAKALETIGWRPRTQFDEGLKNILRYRGLDIHAT
jgi:UDP-glucose 4-epimerase